MADYRDYSLEQLQKCKHDNEAWYWLGMTYFGQHDIDNAAVWFEKAMNDSGNEWAAVSTLYLGILRDLAGRGDEALGLFEGILQKMPDSAMTRLNAAFVYFKGTETKEINPSKALQYIEQSIRTLIADDGDDEYLKQIECFKISEIFSANGKKEKAKEYLQKTIARCDTSYESDRELKELAEDMIRQM